MNIPSAVDFMMNYMAGLTASAGVNVGGRFTDTVCLAIKNQKVNASRSEDEGMEHT